MTDGTPDGFLEDLTVMTRISKLMGKLAPQDCESVAEWVAKKWAPEYGAMAMKFRQDKPK